MRNALLMSAFSASVIAVAVPAEAETVTVRAGVATPVAAQTIYDADTCLYGALPSAQITQPPAHGAVEPRKFTFVVRPGERCTGKTFKGTMLVYTPARGYRGADSFSFIFSWDTFTNATGTSTRSGTVSLAVQ